MSAKLRQLLFDKHSLADAINNGTRLEFHVGTFPPHMSPEGDPYWKQVVYQALEDGIDPETSLRGNAIALSRGEFGQHVIAYSRGQRITVKDVVRHNANAKGGVHLDLRSKPGFEKLAHLEALQVGGYSAASRSLRAIARVSLKGLTPLIKLAKSRTS